MAPPSKLTPEIQELICADLRRGIPFAIACEYYGVDGQTGYEWRRKGENRDSKRDPTPETEEFAAKVKQAIAAFDRAVCLTLADAAANTEDALDDNGNPMFDEKTLAVKQKRIKVPFLAIETSKYLIERRRPELFDQSRLAGDSDKTAERPKINIILPEDLKKKLEE